MSTYIPEKIMLRFKTDMWKKIIYILEFTKKKYIYTKHKLYMEKLYRTNPENGVVKISFITLLF